MPSERIRARKSSTSALLKDDEDDEAVAAVNGEGEEDEDEESVGGKEGSVFFFDGCTRSRSTTGVFGRGAATSTSPFEVTATTAEVAATSTAP